jgi:hypothetical protein
MAWPYVYVKIIERIQPNAWGILFEGSLHRPGAVLEADFLPQPAVAIECAGPVGTWQRGKRRPCLYILWLFDHTKGEWIELARAQAVDASWMAALQEPARQALHPRPELLDIVERSQSLADELVEAVDGRLIGEIPEVRASALYSIYERLAGEIAAFATLPLT